MRGVSIVSIVYGTLGLLFAGVTMAALRIYYAIFENFPFPGELYGDLNINAFLEGIVSFTATLFPFIFLIGIIYILSGILYLAENPYYRTFAYMAAILNIIWYIAYVVLIEIEIIPLINSMELLPGRLINFMVVLSMIINAVFYCGYPVFLLLYLNKEKEWDTPDTGYNS